MKDQRNYVDERACDLADSINSIILKLDREGQVVYWNSFAEQFFGYPAEEMIGGPSLGTLFPLSEQGDLALQDLQAGGSHGFVDHNNLVTENVKRNGERVRVAWSAHPLLDPRREPAGMLYVGNDVTMFETADEALLESKQQIHTFLESLSDPIVSVDGR